MTSVNSSEKKHHLFKKWKTTNQAKHYSKYKHIRNRLANSLKRAKKAFLGSLVDSSSPGKRFWGYIKSLSGKPSIPDTIQYNDVLANNPKDIANLFSQFFAECFNPSDIDVLDYSFSTNNLSHISCTPEDVFDLICLLDTSSAAGVDDISGAMLKGTASSVSAILSHIFNLSLSTGKVPAAWKVSRIIPIFKSGDKNNVKNYRPISLQPIISKILERIIHKNILNFLQENNLLTDRQFGFLPNSSTTDALLTAISDWHTAIEARDDVVVALFDLAKAFDKVPHKLLLQKLSNLGITGQLLSWLCSYLTNRSQCVVVHGSTSLPVPVLSGVPQGSVLGPLLFLIFINNLCRISFSAGCMLVLYADDTTLYKPIKNHQDIINFQADINKIHEWFSFNFLQANAKKTKAMVISTKLNPYPDLQLYLNDQPIEMVKDITFLGIHITSKLSWNCHIDAICKKSRKIIGLIHRNFHSAPVYIRYSLYISLVRPILEYSCVTLHPLNKSLTNRLESVQRFACRVILQSWNLSAEDLLSFTSLQTLEGRRDSFTVRHVYKILAGLSSSPNLFIPHSRSSSRCNHSRALYPPFRRLTLCQRSFFHHGPKLWNNLPDSVVSASSLHIFKTAVNSLIV